MWAKILSISVLTTLFLIFVLSNGLLGRKLTETYPKRFGIIISTVLGSVLVIVGFDSIVNYFRPSPSVDRTPPQSEGPHPSPNIVYPVAEFFDRFDGLSSDLNSAAWREAPSREPSGERVIGTSSVGVFSGSLRFAYRQNTPKNGAKIMFTKFRERSVVRPIFQIGPFDELEFSFDMTVGPGGRAGHFVGFSNTEKNFLPLGQGGSTTDSMVPSGAFGVFISQVDSDWGRPHIMIGRFSRSADDLYATWDMPSHVAFPFALTSKQATGISIRIKPSGEWKITATNGMDTARFEGRGVVRASVMDHMVILSVMRGVGINGSLSEEILFDNISVKKW